MIPARQMRLRVLEALQRRSRQFRTRHELWPLRVPHEPVPLGDVVEEALAGAHRGFDTRTLRSRTLLSLEWEDGTRWDAWVVVLPSGLQLYCDSDAEEERILASGRRDAEGGELDTFFLELLAESAGEHFGIGTSGAAPSRVRSSIPDRRFLVDVFVNLFEVAGTEDSVRSDLAHRQARGGQALEPDHGDFRRDVERWLDAVLV